MDFIDANTMMRAPHPPYSPRTAPSGCFLFGDLKRQFSGNSFDNANDPSTAIQGIMDGFEKTTLIRVFDEWVRRLETHIETEGRYVE
jgi:hypothetical protein